MKTPTTNELLAPWRPTADDPFDLRRAGHLARRAGFGAPLATRRRWARDGVDSALDELLDAAPDPHLDAPRGPALALGRLDAVQAYRVWRLLEGRRPLAERMTIFWHDHFATSHEKVSSVRMMANQLALFDEHGTGSFEALLLGVVRDPAMIRWLDNDTNVKGRPNENLARELFELFALGRGHDAYTERDIQEAARAFTGWHLQGEEFRFRRWKHDPREKEVFGAIGRFDGADIVELTVRQAACPRFLAGKLLAHFVHPEPTEREVAAMAAELQRHDLEILPALRTLLRSRLFFSRRAYRSRVRTPIDHVVMLVRDLGLRASPTGLARAAASMGQELLRPPSVEGWPRERAWIHPASWLLRSNYVAELLTSRGGQRVHGDLEAVLAGDGGVEATVDRALDTLLDGETTAERRASLHALGRTPAVRGEGGAVTLIQAVCNLPEAHLL